MVYSDEDKMSMDGHKFLQPHFKPDYNPDLLCTVNYICHLFVVITKVIGKVGMLRKEFDGAQDYDFIFRCVEAVKDRRKIQHVPKILYHWRVMKNLQRKIRKAKPMHLMPEKAFREHYRRMGIHAEVF